jgi:hypothetical protein
VVLDEDVQRAVVVEREVVAIADREPVQLVRDLESLGVVQRERPERVHRRELLGVHVPGVAAVSGEWLAVSAGVEQRVDRVIGQVRAESDQLHARSHQVIGAVVADVLGHHPPKQE